MGTSLVTGSAHPPPEWCTKLVEVDGIAVAKRASHKGVGGRAKSAIRLARASGTVVEEVIYRTGATGPRRRRTVGAACGIPLVRGGASR